MKTPLLLFKSLVTSKSARYSPIVFALRKISFLFVMYVYSCLSAVGQCGSETYTMVNQCLGQQPQVIINGAVVPTTTYNWFDLTPKVPGPGNDTLKLGLGNNVVYPAPLTAGGETFYYQKEITNSGGPTALPGPLATGGMGNLPSNSAPYSMSFSSTTDVRLNYVTVAFHAYSACNASDTYRFQVQVGSTFSQWYYFKCSNWIATSNSNIFLVRVPVYATPTDLGLYAAAGTTTIRIHNSIGGGANRAIDAYEWFNRAAFSTTYTVGSSVIINYAAANVNPLDGQANKVPGLFDWQFTILCTPVTVTITPTSSGCCVPGNVSAPLISSSTGSNIVNTDPIVPTITLSTPLQSGYYYQWLKDGVPIGGAAQGTNVNSISISTVGKYTVKVAENASFIGLFSCAKDNLMWVQKRILFAQADKTTICLGESVNLLAKGATGPTTWSPATNMVGASTVTPVFTPTAPGTFPLSVTGEVPVGNQIINGDFESGNIQVNPSAYYTYVNPATAGTTTPAYAIGYPARKNLSIGVGNYTINDYVFWPGFQAWLPIQDHTTGSGKFLYTDASGSNAAGNLKFIWSQDVVVQPNTNYEFAAWVTNFNAEGDATYVVPSGVSGITVNPASNPLPDLMLYVNDVAAFASPPVISAKVGLWQKISATWNSGSLNGTVKLKLSEIFPGPATGGHDFALDDISFGAPGTQTDNVSIVVNDCYYITATAAGCVGDSVLITAQTNGVFQNWRNTTSGTPTTVAIGNPLSISTKVKSQGGTATQFTATAKFIFGNLITNPDFSDYNSGFSSTYTTANVGSSMNPGQYLVGTLPATIDPSLLVNKRDHTTNTLTPTYFVGDSRYDATRSVAYRTTVPVVNGQEYGFSAWFANVHKEFLLASPDTMNSAPYPSGAKTTRLDLYINNQYVKRIQLPLDTVWRNYTANWTANTTGNVNIELRSVNVAFASLRSGFAMDDLTFGTTFSSTKTVDVTTPTCALPVVWLGFDLKLVGNNILVDWSTAAEYSTSRFEVQRSNDGIHFETIGEVIAKGNVNQGHRYTFTDLLSSSEVVYYRIKSIDYDESISYTQIKSIRLGGFQLFAYPNPSDRGFNLKLEGDSEAGSLAQISLFDMAGNEVLQFSAPANQVVGFGESLTKGVYILKVQWNGQSKVIRLVRI